MNSGYQIWCVIRFDVLNSPDILAKILGATADNASSNDTMTEHMGELVAHFGGTASQVRCVLHITNLVAKSLIKPFDVPKRGHQGSPEGDTESEHQWAESEDMGEQSIRDNEDNEDNSEGWVNEMELLSTDEQARLDEDVHPLQKVLVKVSTKKKR